MIAPRIVHQDGPFRVEREGRSYRVIDGRDSICLGAYDMLGTAIGRAARAATQLRKETRYIMRPCLCCETPFQSEGIHNRLCNSCRARGDAGAFDVAHAKSGFR